MLEARVVMEPSRSESAASRPDPWPRMWHALCSLPLVAVVVVFCFGRAWKGPLYLEPLLAVPPALAGIGATKPRRPLIYGGISLLTALLVATRTVGRTPSLTITTVISVVVVTAVSAAGAVLSSRRNQKLADVMTVAEVAQRALLRPLPRQVGPLEVDVLYLAAAAEARVGGDLYEVARTPYGIRMIMGDVRGKGLGAVEVAADVLGVFREAAHDVYTLAEVARRLDASLVRRDAVHEEFVTAVLVEVDPEVSTMTIYNCGHPSPMILTPGGRGDGGDAAKPRSVTVADVPIPAPPLGLMSLGDCSGASRRLPFKPGDELLLYTDGITEARDAKRRFYPLAERLPALAGTSQEGSRPDLLKRLKNDVLRHVGAPLDDDAALLRVRAAGARTASADGAAGPSQTLAPAPGTASL
jgi:serine phosphatase RsbU (regulator of sigma subunit)